MRTRWLWLSLALIVAAAGAAHAQVASGSDGDVYEDEVKVVPTTVSPPVIEEDDGDFESWEEAVPEEPEPKPTPAPTTSTQETTPQEKSAAPRAGLDWSNMYLEALLVAGLIAYGVNYFTGTKKNATIASVWASVCSPIMSENFAHINNNKPDEPYIEASSNDFVLYGSGRRHCKSLTAHLSLLPRSDLLAVVSARFTPAPDTLSIFAELQPNAAAPFVFAVVPRRSEKKLRGEYEDLKHFTKVYSGDKFGLPGASGATNGLVVLAENMDIASLLLSEDIVAVLDKYQDSLQYLYITDQFVVPRAEGEEPGLPTLNKVLMVKFNIPIDHLASAKLQSLVLKMTTLLIDVAGTMSISAQARASAEKERQAFADVQYKKIQKDLMAKAYDRKTTKLREERDKAAAKGPAALAQWEEQQRKKQSSKKQGMMFRRA
eukprot:m.237644 g.237644  ORF g.237644 m.237644 type:complete len:432 (+) comp13175_c0_seq1:36-1331(+)